MNAKKTMKINAKQLDTEVFDEMSKRKYIYVF